MGCDNGMRYIQAQTEFPSFRRLKRLEQPTELCGWHATARILYRQAELMPEVLAT
jgi:hypothetical protein